MKKLFKGVLLVGALFGCIMLLQKQDQVEKNNAIERCGGLENVVEKYTSQGDVYFTCKVEK